MSTIEVVPASDDEVKEDGGSVLDDESPDEDEAKVAPKEIIRYSLPTLLSLRSSKLSQAKPACKNLDLSCMAHHKPPQKMLIANNMMPKFAQSQMQHRGEESISPLSFHSNSSSSSNLSYQKRYQDGGREADGGGYSNSRYYYNKYNKYDDNGGSSRIIYKTTGANANNGNNIRFLKKAYNSKYENQESSVGLISNKNILDNSSRVITAADHRNLKKTVDLSQDDDNSKKGDDEKKSPTDDTNNNEKKEPKADEVNANELLGRNSGQNDLKNLPDDITNHMDDMFNNLNMNQLLPEKMTDERESSRFSKWFTVEAKDEKTPDTQNNNNDGNGGVAFPQSVESEKYFQPIDKVESNSLFQLLKGPPEAQKEENPLLQMIQQQQQKSPGSGQVHSVEELEARLRQHKVVDDRKSNENEQKVLQNFFQQQLMPNLMQQQQQQQQHQPQPMTQNQEDVNAFKKLLSQMANEETKMPAQMTPNGQNLLQQMMNKSFPQHGGDVMMQPQQQKGFPINKMPAKMMNPIGSPNPMMIPPQQFGNNVDMMKFLQQKMPVPQIPEVMKRPEVQAIVLELTSGEISQYSLWQRLTTPGLSPIERDIITSALNIFNANSNNGNSGMFQKPIPPIGANNLFPQIKPNALSAPIPMPQGSPLSPVPPPLDQHLLFQHQAAAAAANKLRLSPLPAAGIPQRIPSPRELQYHTQSIMQNALIRKKLEEQRENFRKRQEQEQKEQMQKQECDRKHHQDLGQDISPAQSPEEMPKCGPLDSPIKKASGVPPSAHLQMQRQHAPSPNIFTPTSVLRKMTAEKENDGSKMGSEKKKAIIGASSQSQAIRSQHQPQQQQQFMGNMSQMERMVQMQAQNDAFGKVNWDAQSSMKPQVLLGRPIVKGAGPGSSQPQSNSMMSSAQQQPNMMSGNYDYNQQQQIQKMNLQKQFIAQQQQQQQIMQMKKQQQMDNPVLTQFMAQQQQRAQQQQQHMIRSQQQFPQQMSFQQQMMQSRPKEQDEMENRNMVNNGGCLSPTSNQLAKWFSPELLADASAGKLPSMNGQMLSLEEFEKCIQNS